MRFSYNWLKELLPGLTQSPEEVARLLTMHSFETVIAGQINIDPLIKVVKVEKIDPHPNADRLRLIIINDGQTSTRLVCGAHNFGVGDIVPWAVPGASVQDENGQPFILKKAKIRGEVSPGMLTSWRELGLGNSHTGIFVLPADTPVGTALADHILADTIFEAEIMPNRAHDSLCLLGIARDLSALIDRPVSEAATMDLAAIPALDTWQINLETPAARRYMGALVTDTQHRTSPLWLQARLLVMGARPINLLVDITNYVMFVTGNPIHAFDADKLPSKTIGVRQAEAGEQVITLDGEDRQLAVSDVVITDGHSAVAIAGIMGGQSTEVDEQTKNVFLEVANFAPVPIQQTAVRLGLRTEGAIRWGKDIEPARAQLAMAYALQLFETLGGLKIQGLTDVYPHPLTVPVIQVNITKFSSVAGTTIEPAVAKQLLEKVRFQVDDNQGTWSVIPPADRLDITGEHDVVEEVIRLVGLDKIPVTPPQTQPVPLPVSIQWREIIRDLLVAHGYIELYNYSFAAMATAKRLGFDKEPHIELNNPMAPELNKLRGNLLPGLLNALVHNQQEFRRQALFEIGTVFRPDKEATHLGIVLMGEGKPEEWLQGVMRTLAITLGVHPTDLVPTVTVLPAAIQKQLKLRQAVVYTEINLDELIPHATHQPPAIGAIPTVRPQYQSLSKFPPVFRDVSVLVSRQTPIEAVSGLITKLGQELVVDVDLFDVYTAADNPEHYSLAFQIKYQASDRTLTAAEVETVHNRIIKGLEQELSAVLRQ